MPDVTELERKLDLLIALARVGLRDELAQRRAELDADAVSIAVLEHTSDWIAAGDLKAAARGASGESESTVKRRIADLVSSGAVTRRGSGGSITYRSTGLFEV